MTPGFGLRAPEEILTIDDLKAIASVEVDERNLPYRKPLEQDALRIAESIRLTAKPFSWEAYQPLSISGISAMRFVSGCGFRSHLSDAAI